MASKPNRRPTILDAIVMIAAIAIGLAWTRYFIQCLVGRDSYPYPDYPALYRLRLVSWWAWALSHCVAAVTIAVPVMRSFGPRLPLRSLTRQPGVVACGAVVLAISVDMLAAMGGAAETFVSGEERFEHILSTRFFYAASFVIAGGFESLAVATAWLLLRISGRWRSEPDWIDRLGRALGVFWLVVPPLSWFVEILAHVLE